MYNINIKSVSLETIAQNNILAENLLGGLCLTTWERNNDG